MSTTKTQRVHMWSDNVQLQKPILQQTITVHCISLCYVNGKGLLAIWYFYSFIYPWVRLCIYNQVIFH